MEDKSKDKSVFAAIASNLVSAIGGIIVAYIYVTHQATAPKALPTVEPLKQSKEPAVESVRSSDCIKDLSKVKEEYLQLKSAFQRRGGASSGKIKAKLREESKGEKWLSASKIKGATPKYVLDIDSVIEYQDSVQAWAIFDERSPYGEGDQSSDATQFEMFCGARYYLALFHRFPAGENSFRLIPSSNPSEVHPVSPDTQVESLFSLLCKNHPKSK